MTEYTLKQMLDKLERNPNLKFKYVEEEPYRENEEEVIALDEIGRVVNEEGKSILSKFTLNSKFALVNEPVNVKEAFKAFEEGKPIYCDYERTRYCYKPESLGKVRVLENQFSSAVTAEQILHGKWFIEEGENK